MKLPVGNVKRKTFLVLVVTLIIVSAIAGLTVSALAGGSPATSVQPSMTPPPPPPPPFSGMPGAVPPPTQSDVKENGVEVLLAGPQTSGAEITIAGKTIKLPEDAQLGGLVVDVLALQGVTNPMVDHLPLIIIQRGSSEVYVGLNDGIFVYGVLASGEEGAFDFLKEAFPNQDASIDVWHTLPNEVVAR